MTKHYTATRGFPYKTRHLVAGEPFEADEKLGALLVKMGKAKEVSSRPAAVGPVATPVAAPAAPAPAPQPVAVVPEPVNTEPQPAPVLAETVEPEPAVQDEPQIIPEIIPAPPAQDEPAKPAFKTRRTYGSKSP